MFENLETFVAIDTETTGLNFWEHQILSVGLVVVKKGEITAKKEVKVKYPTYNVTAGALNVNKINLVEHDKIALTPYDAIAEINNFIQSFAIINSKPVRVVGHNYDQFDLQFMANFFRENNPPYSRLFSSRLIDTCVLMRALYDSGIIQEEAFSLEKALKLFEIEREESHTALDDAIATAQLYLMILNILSSLGGK
jgi:DNA polymerase III epsilon subunit-like protein